MRLPLLLTLAALAATHSLPAQRAFALDSNLDQLFSVDLATGAATLIAGTANNGLATPADLAWDNATDTLWTIDLSGGEVGTIDIVTGVFTPVYQTNLSGWQAMAWDPIAQKFYLNNQTNPDLYELDPATGLTTQIGDTQQGLITAMAIDAAGTLWGIEFSSGTLVTIDRTTAAATVVGTAISGIQGMGFAPGGTLYGANTNTDSLYTIDTVTGTATLVGAHGAGIQFVKGFTIEGGGISASGTGCRDSGGVQLAMTWSGTPALGNTIQIGCTVQNPNSFTLLFGLSNTSGPLGPLPYSLGGLAPGCTLYTSSELAVGPIPNGIQFPLTVPTLPSLVGASLYVQGIEIDTGLNALGIAFANYLAITIE